MVLVTVCSCPQIIADSRLEEELLDDALPIEDIVDCVCARTVKINVVTVQNLELIGQVCGAQLYNLTLTIRLIWETLTSSALFFSGCSSLDTM